MRTQPTSQRVLIVEDDYFVAEDLRLELVALGAEVLGPVASVADAMAPLARSGLPTFAILDIQLGDETVYRLADWLREQDVTLFFVTGHDRTVLPDRYAGCHISSSP